ncbi:proto-oncogene tyrosine-protein kinase ROS-like isoform X2 [Branchiostoma floridae x Branchiostoma belcheri]
MVANLLSAFLLFSAVFCQSDAQDLLSQCRDECDNSMLVTNAIDRDLSCDSSCKISSCKVGCDSWTNTSIAECTKTCNESFTANSTVKVAPCSTGCTFAQDVYVERIKAALNPPSPPYLPSSDLVSNDSVVLQWAAANSSLVTYLVQWRFDHGNSDWRFYQSAQPLQDPNVTVSGLHAYTTYRFRVLWLLTSDEFIPSPQSQPIQTLPFGAPSSAPIITQITSPTKRSVYVAWNPPQFPNRPLVAYNLILTNLDQSTALPVYKDLPATQRYYQFSRNVRPNTTYSVEVRAQNSEGMGPAAVANITTLATNPESDSVYPVLLMGTNHHILRVDLDGGDDYFDETEDDVLFESANDSVSIIGVAFHVRRRQVYYSDTAGTIGRVSMANSSDTAVILTAVNHLSYLSVDWLHDRLYYVSGQTVMRCALDGTQQEVVLQYLSQPPGELLVNPYHGYLYWTQAGVGGGLYRMDLAHAGQTNLTNSTTHQRIADQDHLQAVTISYSSLRLFFPDRQMNVMLSTFIDGSDQEDFHANTQSPQLTDVKSLTHFEESFFWTRGDDKVYKEHLNEGTGQFFHNQFSFNFEFFLGPFVGLEMYHPSMQPVPVPANPPQDLTVLFGEDSVFLSWSEPEQLSTFGKGAWKDWRYELEVHNLDSLSENSTRVSDITAHNYTLQQLEKGTQYSFSVRAYSEGGNGPWSDRFVGRVYSQVSTAPRLVLVTPEGGMVQSNMDGSAFETVHPNITDATDLAWMDSNLYYLTSGGEVAYWNSSGEVQEASSLPWVTSARAIAVDWIGKKLYWADSAQHRICRSQLNGDSMEQVLSASVQDLEVNALSGHLFWTSAHAVERARLNGQDRTRYWSVENFSGRQLAGITLDTLGEMVYWLVSGLDMLDLYRASSTAEGPVVSSTVQLLGPVNSYTLSHVLHFYDGKLFWLDSDSRLAVRDVNSSDVITVPMATGKLTTFTVVQPSLQPLPVGYNSTPSVVPEVVNPSEVAVSGTWDDFNITWATARGVEYGTTLYDLTLHYGNRLYAKVTSDNHYTIADAPPYTPLVLTLLPFTYWGSAGQVTVHLRSPESAPTVPVRPRVFITENSDPLSTLTTYTAQFRWSPPRRENGLIQGYNVFYQNASSQNASAGSSVAMTTVSNSTFQFTLENLEPGTTYSFQVEGFTSAGIGPRTQAVNASTQVVSPPPQLLVIGDSGLSLADMDTNQETALTQVDVDPVAVGYLGQEDTILFVDAGNDRLFSVKRDGTDLKQLVQLDSAPATLAVDWVGRGAYWLEGGGMFRYRLEGEDPTPTLLATGLGQTGALVIDPLQSTLFWTATVDNRTNIWTSDLEGTNRAPLFPSSPQRTRRDANTPAPATMAPPACTCPQDIAVGPGLSIDGVGGGRPEVYFCGEAVIWAADTQGCVCRVVYNGTGESDTGLPCDSLTVDASHVYWTNTDQSLLCSLEKASGRDKTCQNNPGANSVLSFSPSLQPFPDPSCLTPVDYNRTAQLNGSALPTTLPLSLMPAEQLPACSGISLATVTYTIHFVLLNGSNTTKDCGNGLACSNKTTQSLHTDITGLRPHSHYLLQVSAQNFYTRKVPALGPSTTLKTAIGVPSPAVNVTAAAMLPDWVDVFWSKPLVPNGPLEDIMYRVQYQLESAGGVGVQEMRVVTSGVYNASIRGLQPGKNYTFKVIANSVAGSSESLQVREATFPAPADLQVIDLSNTTMLVSWQPLPSNVITQHALQWAEKPDTGDVPDADWRSSNDSLDSNDTLWNITELQAYREYLLRVQLTYTSGQLYRSQPLTQRTQAGVPGPPTSVAVRRIKGEFDVSWAEPDRDNGAEVTDYILQCAVDDSNITESDWMTKYEGNETGVIVSDLTSGIMYVFRVAALNDLGQGPYSLPSQPIRFEPAVQEQGGNVAGIIAACVMVGVVLVLAVIIIVILRRRRHKGASLAMDAVGYRPDLELARLRDLPRDPNFHAENSALYAVSALPELDVSKLPLYPRHKLSLTKMLGSGAFGEVFEGTATDILGPGTGDTRVAVKTLHKGATDQEKGDFLKEAHLMSQFKHGNIVALRGVCLDNNPQYIILELMDQGDLKSYLHANRPNPLRPSQLDLMDLIDICLDVTRGCKYLEEMHFVHRDLAARNCLVDTQNNKRTVKIGDFGLARDIYRNDYYRKEGEGLLPVRWMSPESLVDGVFTSQSDVWSFGVLLWEIMTMGNQPYPARTNLEVMHFVRSGGRLDKPYNCPDDIHQLMLRCWSKNASNRPTFRYSLDFLERFKRTSVRGSLGAAGVDNRGYQGDGDTAGSRVRGQSDSGGVYNNAFSDDEDEGSKSSLAHGGVLETVTRGNSGINYLQMGGDGEEGGGTGPARRLNYLSMGAGLQEAAREDTSEEPSTKRSSYLDMATVPADDDEPSTEDPGTKRTSYMDMADLQNVAESETAETESDDTRPSRTRLSYVEMAPMTDDSDADDLDAILEDDRASFVRGSLARTSSHLSGISGGYFSRNDSQRRSGKSPRSSNRSQKRRTPQTSPSTGRRGETVSYANVRLPESSARGEGATGGAHPPPPPHNYTNVMAAAYV